MASRGACRPRRKSNCPKIRCVCSDDSDSTEESSDSSESSEIECTCPKKKPANNIRPDYLSSSPKTKKNKSRATSKAKNRVSRKPLQERLKKKYPSSSNLCNTICLCNQDIKPKYSEDTIRKVPPQPNNCCPKDRKLEKRSPRNKSRVTQDEYETEGCTPIYIANENKNKKNCSTETENIQCSQLCKENEDKNKKLFKSRTIMTDDYATFDCIQIEIESDDGDLGCNCKQVEDKQKTQKQQQKEKEVQANLSEENNKKQSDASKKADKQTKSSKAEPDKNPIEEKNKKQTEDSKKASKQKKSSEAELVKNPSDEKNKKQTGDSKKATKQKKSSEAETVQDKSTILKRCICFVKKRNGEKKPQKMSAKEENCECISNDSHLSVTPKSSECICEDLNEKHSASMKYEQCDIDENCSCSYSNTELKQKTSSHKKQAGQSSNNPDCSGPQNIEIHIGKSNARITIIRDLD